MLDWFLSILLGTWAASELPPHVPAPRFIYREFKDEDEDEDRENEE